MLVTFWEMCVLRSSVRTRGGGLGEEWKLENDLQGSKKHALILELNKTVLAVAADNGVVLRIGRRENDSGREYDTKK